MPAEVNLFSSIFVSLIINQRNCKITKKKKKLLDVICVNFSRHISNHNILSSVLMIIISTKSNVHNLSTSLDFYKFSRLV